ncbi:MAG TPA: 2-oxo acid dehydrogenase subunit E2 [Bryobacteraceae bacterium]|jgi:pyruvate/2-oxoglutarate dehydrogenase complex dihydrolipoamide acyltransferase (E2) component
MTPSRRLDYAERWLRDGLEVCRPAAQFLTLDIDMTRPRALLQIARQRGIRVTYTHILVRAAALALAAHPELHQMVCGSRLHHPNQVDIGLSVAGESFVAPVLVIENAAGKNLPALSEEIARRTPEIQAADRRMLQTLRRWGWLLPFGILRRTLLRCLFRSAKFRRKGTGTFQVSIVPEVDEAFTSLFTTSAILVAGRVRDRVVAVEGLPAVRPTVTLSCSADHRVWDGKAAQRFLLAVRQALEETELGLCISE